MLEEIMRHKPIGATHWEIGVYYKIICDQEIYEWVGGDWNYIGHVDYMDELGLALMTSIKD